jgi:hypothetical protein
MKSHAPTLHASPQSAPGEGTVHVGVRWFAQVLVTALSDREVRLCRAVCRAWRDAMSWRFYKQLCRKLCLQRTGAWRGTFEQWLHKWRSTWSSACPSFYCVLVNCPMLSGSGGLVREPKALGCFGKRRRAARIARMSVCTYLMLSNSKLGVAAVVSLPFASLEHFLCVRLAHSKASRSIWLSPRLFTDVVYEAHEVGTNCPRWAMTSRQGGSVGDYSLAARDGWRCSTIRY